MVARYIAWSSVAACALGVADHLAPDAARQAILWQWPIPGAVAGFLAAISFNGVQSPFRVWALVPIGAVLYFANIIFTAAVIQIAANTEVGLELVLVSFVSGVGGFIWFLALYGQLWGKMAPFTKALPPAVLCALVPLPLHYFAPDSQSTSWLIGAWWVVFAMGCRGLENTVNQTLEVTGVNAGTST